MKQTIKLILLQSLMVNIFIIAGDDVHIQFGQHRDNPAESVEQLARQHVRAQTHAANGQGDTYYEQLQNTNWKHFLSNPQNLATIVTIGIGVVKVSSQLYEQWQSSHIIKINTEHAKFNFDQAKKNARREDRIFNLKIQAQQNMVENDRQKLERGNQLLRITDNLYKLNQKIADGQELTETEKERYETLKNMVAVLTIAEGEEASAAA